MRTATSKSGILIDSIHMGEVRIDAITDPKGVRLEGKAAYINAETGQRLGSTTSTQWSQKTWNAMQALLDSMEQDVLSQVFGENAASGVDGLPITTIDGVPGL